MPKVYKASQVIVSGTDIVFSDATIIPISPADELSAGMEHTDFLSVIDASKHHVVPANLLVASGDLHEEGDGS